jgi:hypothetical protein
MNTVYVIQEPHENRDFSSAKEYGKLQFILSAGENPSLYPAKAIGILRTALKNFSGSDYIVWAGGDPMSPILAGIVLGQLGFKEINFLKWDRQRREGVRTGSGFYVPARLILRNL